MPHNKTMTTKLLTFLLALTFLFFFSIFTFGEEPEVKKEYWKNGKLKIEVRFKGGKREGLTTAWYESGEKKREAKIKDGKIMYDKHFVKRK
jgi:hypothetical protein